MLFFGGGEILTTLCFFRLRYIPALAIEDVYRIEFQIYFRVRGILRGYRRGKIAWIEYSWEGGAYAREA